ncbi:hypothetical protein CFRS1_v011199 [Colletotrichum fructicola]|nr:hypothetical protein CFRS1_v011199 [Colletotrichum fructicola]
MASPQDTTLGLRVKLSHLLSSIINTVYKSEKTALGKFLEETKSILHTLAGHAQEIEKITRVKFQNSCVVIATRPLLLSALKQQLDHFGRGLPDMEGFMAPLIPLMSTGIKSAVKTLQILSGEDTLIEVFLPFDLDEPQPLVCAPETPSNAEFLDSIGISSDDFLSIVEQMGSHDDADLPFAMLDLSQFWK